MASTIPNAFAQAIDELPRSLADRRFVGAEVLSRIAALDRWTIQGLDGGQRGAARFFRELASRVP